MTENEPIVQTVRADFVKRGILLEYFTIGWNLVEGLVAFGWASQLEALH